MIPASTDDRLNRSRKSRTRLLILAVSMCGLVIVCTFYVELYLFSRSHGTDFDVFDAAATALARHLDPYEATALIPIQEQQANWFGAGADNFFKQNPYLNPPLLAEFLRLLGQGANALRIWTVLQIVALATGTLLAVRLVGWPRRKVWALLLPLSPACYLAVYYGQLSPFSLLSAIGAFIVAPRRPRSAAVLIMFGMVKPQIMAGPLVMLALEAWRLGSLRRYIEGLLIASAVLGGITYLTAGSAVTDKWIDISLSTANTHIGDLLFDPASLTFPLYGLLTSHTASLIVLPLLICWAFQAGKFYPNNPDDNFARARWLALAVTSWLLLTPYVHPYDDILLLPALLVLFHERIGWPTYLAILCWITVPLSWLLGIRVPIIHGLGVLVPATMLLALCLTRGTTCTSGASMHA